MSSPPETNHVHDLIEARLRHAQLRYTKGRRAIVSALLTLGRPVGIAEIESVAQGVPRSSAYRHLVDLQGVGCVRAITASGDFTHFELAEDLTEHHHHLLCLLCGTISDVTPTTAFEGALAEMVHVFARATGFAPLSHALDIVGHCRNCQ